MVNSPTYSLSSSSTSTTGSGSGSVSSTDRTESTLAPKNPRGYFESYNPQQNRDHSFKIPFTEPSSNPLSSSSHGIRLFRLSPPNPIDLKHSTTPEKDSIESGSTKFDSHPKHSHEIHRV